MLDTDSWEGFNVEGSLGMCQATIYLNGEECMRDVINIQPVPNGIRLATFFDVPKVLPATIREIDLLKHRVWLETIHESKDRGDE